MFIKSTTIVFESLCQRIKIAEPQPLNFLIINAWLEAV